MTSRPFLQVTLLVGAVVTLLGAWPGFFLLADREGHALGPGVFYLMLLWVGSLSALGAGLAGGALLLARTTARGALAVVLGGLNLLSAVPLLILFL